MPKLSSRPGKVSGKVEIYTVGRSFSWRLHLRWGESERYEHTVETQWSYASSVSASAAARRWGYRLGIWFDDQATAPPSRAALAALASPQSK